MRISEWDVSSKRSAAAMRVPGGRTEERVTLLGGDAATAGRDDGSWVVAAVNETFGTEASAEKDHTFQSLSGDTRCMRQ